MQKQAEQVKVKSNDSMQRRQTATLAQRFYIKSQGSLLVLQLKKKITQLVGDGCYKMSWQLNPNTGS